MVKLFDDVVKWVPGIIGIFIVFAMFRAFLFYYPFNVSIASYVDLDEIFTLWFFPTILHFAFSCIPLILLIPVNKIRAGEDQYIYYNALPSIFNLGVLIYVSSILFQEESKGSFAWSSHLLIFSITMSVFSIGFAIPLWVKTLSKYKQIKAGKIFMSKRTNWALLFLLAINFTIVSVYRHLDAEIASDSATSIYQVDFIDGRQFVTDVNLRYLGKTKNYFFVFDKAAGKTYIYNNEDIRRITIESDQSRQLFKRR